MQKLPIIIRFILTFPLSFIIATLANKFVWNDYWYKTIYRVQTIDFNILAHTLPTKLSYNLINKNSEEIQRTIDSNFSLFGLIVTDCQRQENLCPEQKILYASRGYRDWYKIITPADLVNQNYDLLYNPPPNFAENKYDNIFVDKRNVTEQKNTGKIIGRVYYIRGIPPNFKDNYLAWMNNPFAPIDVYQKYNLMTSMMLSIGLVFWLSTELVLFKKRQVEKERKLFVEEAISLQNSLSEQTEQNHDLIKQQEELINELQKFKAQQEEHEQILKDEINYLKDLEKLEKEELESLKNERQQLEEQLAIINSIAQEKNTKEINFKQQELIDLEVNIRELEDSNKSINIEIVKTQKQLEKSEAKLIHTVKKIKTLEEGNNLLTNQNIQANQTIHNLEQQISDITYNSNELEIALKAAKGELKNKKRLDQQEIDNILESAAKLEKQNHELIEEKNELEFEILDLKEQLENYQQYFAEYANYQENIYQFYQPITLATLDLSSKTIALVGGHDHVRRQVIKDLVYNLGCELKEVPPSQEQYINEDKVLNTIRNCDLIVVITRYTGHDLTIIVNNLRTSNRLQGEVLWVNVRGKSGIIREILHYFSTSEVA